MPHLTSFLTYLKSKNGKGKAGLTESIWGQEQCSMPVIPLKEAEIGRIMV
jgi:hypothetical protein